MPQRRPYFFLFFVTLIFLALMGMGVFLTYGLFFLELPEEKKDKIFFEDPKTDGEQVKIFLAYYGNDHEEKINSWLKSSYGKIEVTRTEATDGKLIIFYRKKRPLDQ